MISLPIDEVLPVLREALAMPHEAVLVRDQANCFEL
jgi:hypothetical protein